MSLSPEFLFKSFLKSHKLKTIQYVKWTFPQGKLLKHHTANPKDFAVQNYCFPFSSFHPMESLTF